MPRITQRQQYERYQFLRSAWERGGTWQGCFAELSPNDQWKLHRFYRPSESLEFSEFRKHLAEIKQKEPELAHVVGKLYAQFHDIYARHEQVIRTYVPTPRVGRSQSRRRKRGHIVVTALVNPNPDFRQLARLLVRQAMERARAQMDEQDMRKSIQEDLEGHGE